MAITGMFGATAALASDDGFYLYGAIGSASGYNFQSFMDNYFSVYGYGGSSVNYPSAIKLNAGYQFNRNFAIEGGYLGLSDEDYIDYLGDSATNSVSGWDIKAVGILPLSYQFSLLGKLGIADIRSSTNTYTSSPYFTYTYGTSSKSGLTYGLGAKFDFTRAVSLRFDWDSYDSNINVGDGVTPIASNRFNVWTIGLAFTFN